MPTEQFTNTIDRYIQDVSNIFDQELKSTKDASGYDIVALYATLRNEVLSFDLSPEKKAQKLKSLIDKKKHFINLINVVINKTYSKLKERFPEPTINGQNLDSIFKSIVRGKLSDYVSYMRQEVEPRIKTQEVATSIRF